MVGIGLTPAWLAPTWFALPWLAVGLVVGVPAVYYSWHYAPWVPTPEAELARILHSLQLEPNGSFCDLGAGDGRMVLRVHAATGARCTGIEVSPMQYAIARCRLAIQGGPDTTVILADLHTVNLSGFDVLYVWGTAYWVSTPAFSAYLQTALRPGARLVSYHYPLHGLDPLLVDRGGQRPIHVYVMPTPTRPDCVSPPTQL